MLKKRKAIAVALYGREGMTCGQEKERKKLGGGEVVKEMWVTRKGQIKIDLWRRSEKNMGKLKME